MRTMAFYRAQCLGKSKYNGTYICKAKGEVCPFFTRGMFQEQAGHPVKLMVLSRKVLESKKPSGGFREILVNKGAIAGRMENSISRSP